MRAEGRANERFAPDVNGWRCRLTDLFIIVDAMLKGAEVVSRGSAPRVCKLVQQIKFFAKLLLRCGSVSLASLTSRWSCKVGGVVCPSCTKNCITPAVVSICFSAPSIDGNAFLKLKRQSKT